MSSAGPAREPARRNRWPRRWRWIALAGLLGLTGVFGVGFAEGFGHDPSVVRSVLLDRPAPPLYGRTLDGAAFDRAVEHGKVLLVNVWASWCPACRAEQAVLDAAQRQLGPLGLQIIGIDMSDTVANARAFLRATGGVLYPNIEDPNAQLAISWGTFGVPETYLVDRTGTIRAKAVGAITVGWIDQHVTPMLSPH